VDPELIRSIYKEFIIPITKEVEVVYLLQRLSSSSGCIAYTAPEGSVAHLAVHSFFGSDVSDSSKAGEGSASGSVAALNCTDTQDVFGAVMSNKAGFGVVPFESTVAGIGTDTKRLLIESGLLVFAEIVMEVGQYLLSVPVHPLSTGAHSFVHPLSRVQVNWVLVSNCPVAKLTRLLSHSNAFGQCCKWLDENVAPGCERVSCPSTSAAALEVS
jgi:prephenate dehydratase